MVEKLKMQSSDIIGENISFIESRFPNAIVEAYDDEGKLTKKVDFEILKQELSHIIISDKQERYQLTWPDKKKAILLANSSINGTLRPCKEESVDFDNTQNLYIEGDNLDVMKILRETYLNKIKIIYIDPPYNTGSDFVYEDDFAENSSEYLNRSGQYDEQGNRLVKNLDSNGRFHTDWLNMIFPRLKVAKDLLADDGIIFIHIDENEVYTLQLICNEIFGAKNELGTIIWDKRNPKGSVVGVAYQHESILIYCKNKEKFSTVPFQKEKEHARLMIDKVNSLIKKYGVVNDTVRNEYKDWLKDNKNEFTGGELAYNLIDEKGNIYRTVSMAAPDKPETRSHRPLIHPITKKTCAVSAKGWRFTDETMDEMMKANLIEFGVDETTVPNQKYFLKDNMTESVSSLLYYGGSDDAMGLPFDNPKPLYIVKKMVKSIWDKNCIVLDFFSGSATTAHAVMQLNAEDGGNRKFIMVQLPELCDAKSSAYKQGFKNICEMGKERIRRAGKKIINENGLLGNNLDIGFRVLKLDSSNMKNVYYNPKEVVHSLLVEDIDNIKEDRTSLDLLFQVMLELGVELSTNIKEIKTVDSTIYVVDKSYLVACFDKDINDDVVKEMASIKPVYIVLRDASFSDDSSNINCEQTIKTISPFTELKVI